MKENMTFQERCRYANEALDEIWQLLEARLEKDVLHIQIEFSKFEKLKSHGDQGEHPLKQGDVVTLVKELQKRSFEEFASVWERASQTVADIWGTDVVDLASKTRKAGRHVN